jgi:hypothetical protein
MAALSAGPRLLVQNAGRLATFATWLLSNNLC